MISFGYIYCTYELLYISLNHFVSLDLIFKEKLCQNVSIWKHLNIVINLYILTNKT